MPQQPVELILLRQWATHMDIPIWLVDGAGDLLFYNEPAEAILGQRFDETGAMPAGKWSSAFTPVDDEGLPIPPDELPLMMTLTKQRPAHKRLHIRGLDGVLRHIEVTSFPICGFQRDILGAAALFWELSE